MAKPVFVNRKTEKDQDRDYISEVNDVIQRDGGIDINSEAYINAINQYNAGLLKGTVKRLDVPKGFCGYIDPNTGMFRVEPEGLVSELRSSTLYPDNIENPEDVPPVEPEPYPIDQCLAIGLPGSYEYSTGSCGVEDGDNACSGIAWFSGAGTGSEAGSSANNQRVCGGGPGINSNTGLATSSPVAGVSPDYPDAVWEAAEAQALELYESAGYVEKLTKVRNLVGTVITHSFFFNVNDSTEGEGTTEGQQTEGGEEPGPTNWKEGGLRVSVVWDTETEEIYEVRYQRMWLWGEEGEYGSEQRGELFEG